jgi:hypothetical protein
MKRWQVWQGGVLVGVCFGVCVGGSGCDPLSPISGNHTVAVFCDVPVGTPSRCTNAIAAAATISPVDPNAVGASAATDIPATGMAGSGSSASVNGGATSTAAGTTAAAGAGGAGDSASSSGMAGAGQTAAAGTSGGSGSGALDPGALQCPNESCPALPTPTADQMAMAAAAGVMFSIENCCATGGDCGTSLNMAACVRTPDADPQCPSIDAMGFSLVSCCTTDGQCGIDLSQFMMGCIDLTTLGSMSMGVITVPPAQSCKPAA